MLAFKISVLVIEKIGKVASTDDSGSLDFRAWVKNLNFTPPPLRNYTSGVVRVRDCSWILRDGFERLLIKI